MGQLESSLNQPILEPVTCSIVLCSIFGNINHFALSYVMVQVLQGIYKTLPLLCNTLSTY